MKSLAIMRSLYFSSAKALAITRSLQHECSGKHEVIPKQEEGGCSSATVVAPALRSWQQGAPSLLPALLPPLLLGLMAQMFVLPHVVVPDPAESLLMVKQIFAAQLDSEALVHVIQKISGVLQL